MLYYALCHITRFDAMSLHNLALPTVVLYALFTCIHKTHAQAQTCSQCQQAEAV